VVRAVVVMNPRSGGAKVGRFGLIEQAELLGARVNLMGEGDDPATLAQRALEQGAEVRLRLPLTCEIRPRALRVLLPRDRPGIPREPIRHHPADHAAGEQ